MATAAFWQRGETIDRINDTAKTIPANTIQAIGKRIGVVAMEAAPGQKYSVNVVGVYSFPKKASEAITAGADVYWDNTNGVITATAEWFVFILPVIHTFVIGKDHIHIRTVLSYCIFAHWLGLQRMDHTPGGSLLRWRFIKSA